MNYPDLLFLYSFFHFSQDIFISDALKLVKKNKYKLTDPDIIFVHHFAPLNNPADAPSYRKHHSIHGGWDPNRLKLNFFLSPYLVNQSGIKVDIGKKFSFYKVLVTQSEPLKLHSHLKTDKN